MKENFFIAFFIFTLCTLMFSGCGKATGTTHPLSDGKVVVVMFDVSDTTMDESVRRAYLKDFKRVLDKVGPGDIIVADLISADPLSNSYFPINEEFLPFDPLTQNKLIYDKRIARQRDAVLQKAEELLFANRGGIMRTKILDSLQVASRVFETYKRARRTLVIFSDMVEESDHYNFQLQQLTEGNINNIIQKEKRARRLPNLAATSVYVVGASARNGSGSSSQRFMDIERFWVTYFKESGAELQQARYGASLIEFQE